MSGINLLPKRALAYPGTRLTFVDDSSVAYCFGSAVRITHLLPDKGDGDGECLWGENEWAGVSALAANWRAGLLAVCPSGRINPAIHLYSLPEMVSRGTLIGGTDLRYVDVAFSRDGKRVAAFGNSTDHLATVWNVGKASGDEEELMGEKIVESVLPGDMSFLSFNPADSDQLCVGGACGLYFWRIDNLVDTWVISATKAKAITSLSKGKHGIIGEDYGIDNGDVTRAAYHGQDCSGDDPVAAACGTQPASITGGNQPETGGPAGAAVAAEILQLESLVRMGDGKHDSFTCHCWGLQNTLWAINEPGQLARFDANTGKSSCCVTLSRAVENAEDSWVAVGLLMTKTHIVVTGSNGSIDWLTLPSETGEGLEVHYFCDYVCTFYHPIPKNQWSNGICLVIEGLSSYLENVWVLGQVEFSIQLQDDKCSPCLAVTMACNPFFDKIVVGSSNGSLHSIFLDIERHSSEPGVPATGVNLLRTFHRGRVVSLTCLRPLCKGVEQVAGGILMTGGEDGSVRAWTANRGKLCGTVQFSAFIKSEGLDESLTGEKMKSLDERIQAREGKASTAKRTGDISVPVCAVASCGTQPLLAVGLAYGMIHVLFVKQVSAYDVEIMPLWRERLYAGPASQLCFHPTKPLLAVASIVDRAVHVVSFHNPMGDFFVCGVGVAPPGRGGVNSLMWRGNDIIFSTEDCLVCAFPVKSERRARQNRSEPLLWVLRTLTPLHGMRPHSQIEQGPFFAVSADLRVLQVLPALPENEIISSLDAGEPKLLCPLDTLEAHQKGTAVMSASPDGRFMATGGADGLVCLWMVYENQVELLNSALIHAGPVISLAFAANSAHLFTTSLDGTVFGLVLEGLEEGTEAPSSPVIAILERLADKNASKQQNRGSVIDCLEVEPWRKESKIEARDEPSRELDAAGRAQRKVVGEFKARLARIVSRNETLPELEKLDRSEFVVDVAGRDRKVSANEAAAKRLHGDIERKKLEKKLIASRIKAACWDSMEVQKREVWCMQQDGIFVENFAIRRRLPEELSLVQKVQRLRALELRDIRRGTYSASRAWLGLLDEVPSDISWMMNEGRLAPAVDVVEALRNEAVGKGRTDMKGGSGGKGRRGSVTERETTKSRGGGNRNSTKKEKYDGEAILVGDDKGDEDSEDSIEAFEVLEEGHKNDPAHLLYPPLALRTPRQKRTQMILLGEMVLDAQRAFNRHVDHLHSCKEDCVDKVEEKNGRIQDILMELGSDEAFYKPRWLDVEQPEKIFNVDNEMMTRPYESETVKEAHRKVNEEKRRREEEAKGSNDRLRALQDMMHGTLEVKQEELTIDDVKRPAWMDEIGPDAAVTEAQQKEVEDYEIKLKEVQEEQAKRRKALELELKKLRTEVSDVVKVFDERVKELSHLRVQVQMFIASQELISTRLSLGIVEREDDDVATEKLDKVLGELFDKKVLVHERLEGYKLHVERAREEMETLQAEDRQMERNFKKEIQEAAFTPIDMADMMAQLVHLYKLRDHGPTSAGGSSSFRESSTGTTLRTSHRRSQSSRRTANVRENAMTRSKRKRSNRVSSGGSTRGSHGLGPLQEAMRQAKIREKAAKVAENDPFGAVDEQLDKSAASEAVNSDALAQDLDYPGFEVEDQVWNKLLELRASKIRKELELAKQQRLFATLKRKLETLQADCDSVERQVAVIERRKQVISERAYLAEKNIEVLVKLKQGQDEVPQHAVVTDYSDGVLIPSVIVQNTNEEIRKLGKDKILTLNKIKQFRKSINLMQWAQTYLDEQVKDREAYCTDLQLLRVTKKLQAVLKGDRGDREKEIAQKTEATVEMMEGAHDSKVRNARQANTKITQQLQERSEENRRISRQLVHLASGVKAREAVYRTRIEASGGDTNPAQQAARRMKHITKRRRLVDLARTQTGEIEALKAELDRLRQRTFPSFAHVARIRLNHCPDDRL